ncbi:MAG: hypothetical protein FD135_3262, partial [Comamonadaceae bacterium]
NFSFSPDDADSARVRKGKVGGYRDDLDADDMAYVRSFCEESLSPQSKQLIAQTCLPVNGSVFAA